MKVRWFIAGAFLTTFFCISPLHAETAEEMLSACRPIVEAKVSGDRISLPQTFDAGLCWGAFGSLQQVLILFDENGKPALHACVSGNATRTELIAIFVRYVETHPKVYPENFALVAVNAMIKAFPCKSAS